MKASGRVSHYHVIRYYTDDGIPPRLAAEANPDRHMHSTHGTLAEALNEAAHMNHHPDTQARGIHHLAIPCDGSMCHQGAVPQFPRQSRL
jgi:hypothetical protein